ncbi:MAG: class I SAM-dependent methyltransferase [Halanaerobiales bacterium]|nr:class I SAM-dependent methyltransferase [Halanaerobiales bacterium]
MIKEKRIKEHASIHYFFLSCICKMINRIKQVNVIVETGANSGISGEEMILACSNNNNIPNYYGYDAWINHQVPLEKIAQQRLNKYPQAKLIKMDTNKLTLEDLPKNIELAFVDGDHSLPGCLHDLQLIDKNLVKRGHIIVHDMDFHCVQDAVKEWFNEDEYEESILKWGTWYGIYRKK